MAKSENDSIKGYHSDCFIVLVEIFRLGEYEQTLIIDDKMKVVLVRRLTKNNSRNLSEDICD